jgi:hypothetical protein
MRGTVISAADFEDVLGISVPGDRPKPPKKQEPAYREIEEMTWTSAPIEIVVPERELVPA